MQVSELMTPHPYGLQANEPVWRAAELMRRHNIGTVLVYEGTELAGIATDRDLTVRCLASRYLPNGKVRDFMTAHPIAVPLDMNADDALRLMVKHGIGRLCVTDADGHVAGIISFGDLAELAQLVGAGLARTRGRPAA
jgi:CBS domain-containing protein